MEWPGFRDWTEMWPENGRPTLKGQIARAPGTPASLASLTVLLPPWGHTHSIWEGLADAGDRAPAPLGSARSGAGSQVSGSSSHPTSF